MVFSFTASTTSLILIPVGPTAGPIGGPPDALEDGPR